MPLQSSVGINFNHPKYFNPYCGIATNILVYKVDGTTVTSATTDFFTEMARRGLQEQTDWTADTYKTILSISSGSGEVAAYVGCTAGGAETHTVEFTIDGGTPVTITVAGLASGERALLSRDLRLGVDFTTAGAYMGGTQAEETLDADKATFGAITANAHIPLWRNAGRTPKLEFKRSLLIRAKHSVNITNSTATAYSAVMYRKFLES